MSELTPAEISLEEVTADRDHFLSAAKTLESLFMPGVAPSIALHGSVVLDWRIPDGYQCQVFATDGSEHYGATMYGQKEGASGSQNQTAFSKLNPLMIQAMRAYTRHGRPNQYELSGPRQARIYQSCRIPGDQIANFSIIPVQIQAEH